MVTIDALWLAVIWIEGGKHQVKHCILQFTIQSSSFWTLQRNEILLCFVISMGIVGGRIYLCMDAIILPHLKILDCILFYYLNFVHILYTVIHDLEVKDLKKLPPEFQCITNSQKYQQFIQWKALFVEMILVLLQTTISQLKI